MKNIYFHCLALLFVLLCSHTLWAQKATLSGVVTDNNNEPIPSASVKATNTTSNVTSNAMTDLDGNYEIGNLESGSYTVVFSFVGYQSNTKNISLSKGQKLDLSVQLLEDNQVLSEVVVVGYGTQRKRELVGSVARIDTKDITPTIGGSFETGLQGKATGVQIVQNSGAAGSGSVVRIRGVSSIGSGGDPLYVVDGIPISQDYFANGETYGANNNPLNSINPNDIESIDVLKDASAAAIYGSRGANGVIIITTKRGKTNQGKPQVSFSGSIGTSRPTKILDILDANEWLYVRQVAWENDGGVGRAPLPLNLSYDDIAGINTNWYDHVIQTGIKQEYNLGIKQGGKKVQSYFGFGYSNAGSYLVGNSFERLSGRANVDFKPIDPLKISLSTSLARGLNRRVAEAWAGGLGKAQTEALPIYPVYVRAKDGTDSLDENGNRIYYNLYSNPVAQNELQKIRVREWRSISNAAINYQITKSLNLNLTGSYDFSDLGNYTHEDALWTGTYDIAKGYTTRTKNLNTNGVLTYDLPIKNNKHKVKILVGSEYQQSTATKINEEYSDLADQIFLNPAQGENFDTLKYEENNLTGDQWKFISVFSRLNYSLSDKWLFQFTYRRDGSSKFGAKNRFGNFPAFGIGYIVSEESFLRNSKAINFLKLKASIGLTGNASIPWTEQFATYQLGDRPYDGVNAMYQSHLENPNLRWEYVRSFDVGFEIGFLQDRFTADFTYYDKRTLDAILKLSVQASGGIPSLDYYENAGIIENKGIEVGLVSHNVKGKNFQWTTRLNLAHNKNRVIDVSYATPDALDGGFGDTRAIVGSPVNTNFTVLFSHVDPATGRPVYLDLNKNETFIYDIVNNRQTAGDANPDLVGGLTNTFSYKGFTLNTFFSFSLGGQIYDDVAKRQLGVVTDWNMRSEVLCDTWQAPGDDAKLPKLTGSMINWGGNANFWQNNHTLWLEDASFLRLKNVDLSYNLPIRQNKYIRSAIVKLTATNLLTFTNYSGWDPEVARGRENPQQRNVGGSNITYLVPPQEKTYNIGVLLEF